MPQITRVAIRYTTEGQRLTFESAFGVVAYLVSIQGKEWRKPHNGADLYTARDELRANGYALVDEERELERVAGGPPRHVYTEHYRLGPALPCPLVKPTDPNHNDDCDAHDRHETMPIWKGAIR
jgi:hypothetical protein